MLKRVCGASGGKHGEIIESTSKEQFDYASNRIQQEGLGEKVSIKYSDYRDIENKYTNIASIEMFEAVGKKYWEKYFSILKNSLANSGKAALQIITIDDQRAIEYQRQSTHTGNTNGSAGHTKRLQGAGTRHLKTDYYDL